MYLFCACGNGLVVRVLKLRDSQAGSVVEEVGGWQCANVACGKPIDSGKLLRAAQLQKKVAELRQSTEELAAEGASAEGVEPLQGASPQGAAIAEIVPEKAAKTGVHAKQSSVPDVAP